MLVWIIPSAMIGLAYAAAKLLPLLSDRACDRAVRLLEAKALRRIRPLAPKKSDASPPSPKKLKGRDSGLAA